MSKRFFYRLNKVVLVSLSLALFGLTLSVSAATYSVPQTAAVNLTWDHNDSLPEGYRVYQRKSGQDYDYTNPVWAGADNLATVYNLAYGTTYHFVVRAYDGALESVDSEEVSYTVPASNDGGSTDSTDPVNSGQADADVIINNGDAGTTTTGTWSVSSGVNPYGSQSFYSQSAGATYTYVMSASGVYNVEMWWTTHSTRSTAVPVKIYDGSTLLETVYVNQQEDGGQWNFLGVYEFSGQARVVIVSEGNGLTTCANAVRFTESTNVTSGNDAASEDVIDDGDMGATRSGSWSVSGGANPYGSQSLYSQGTGATYSYVLAASGTHEIEMWWTTHSTRSTAVPVKIYDGSTLLDTVYVNQQKDGGQWNSLGAYAFSTQAKVVIVSEGNGLTTCADAVRFTESADAALETGSSDVTSKAVIDDGATGATRGGSWSVSGGANPYGSQSLYTYDAGATYSYGLTASGTYEIEMWWTTHSTRSTAVPVKIYDGSTLLDTVYVNQQKDGGQWNSLGAYAFSTQAKVVIVSEGNGLTTCADAVRFTESADAALETGSSDVTSKAVIDDGETGATRSGSWSVSGGANPYGSQSLYTYDAGATYSYGLTASGTYEIEMWWTTHSTRSTAVPVKIYDGSTLLDTVYVNQQKNGGQWNSLGAYAFSTQAKVVIVSEGNGLTTCADAMRFTK